MLALNLRSVRPKLSNIPLKLFKNICTFEYRTHRLCLSLQCHLTVLASQITDHSPVCSRACSVWDKRKHQSPILPKWTESVSMPWPFQIDKVQTNYDKYNQEKVSHSSDFKWKYFSIRYLVSNQGHLDSLFKNLFRLTSKGSLMLLP